MNRFEQLRYERGLTIAEVAAGAEVGRSTVIRVEHGSRPTAKVANKLAKFYGVSLAELLGIAEREAA